MAAMDRLQPYYYCIIWALLGLPAALGAQNDMMVLGPPQLTPDEVTDGTEIKYMIRFQNFSSDTVRHIAIRDTLDPRLDPGTFEIVKASHLYSLVFNNGPVVGWYFNNINLPPEKHAPQQSLGWVIFKIQPKVFLTAGQVIRNRACTVFDDRYSVCTNETLLRIDEKLDANELTNVEGDDYQIYPNPNYGYFDLFKEANAANLMTTKPQEVNCWITDIQGRSVWQGEMNNDLINSKQVVLDRPEPGLYWLHVRTTRRTHVRQFVVLR